MQEKEALIGVYDASGKVVGKKTRNEVDKINDILKGVYIIVVNDKSGLLMIKAKDSLWHNKWGAGAGGLVRIDENVKDAALRTLKREFGIDGDLKFLAEQFYDFNGLKRFATIYFVEINEDLKINRDDFSEWKWISFLEVEKMIASGECMPMTEAALELFVGSRLGEK